MVKETLVYPHHGILSSKWNKLLIHAWIYHSTGYMNVSRNIQGNSVEYKNDNPKRLYSIWSHSCTILKEQYFRNAGQIPRARDSSGEGQDGLGCSYERQQEQSLRCWSCSVFWQWQWICIHKPTQVIKVFNTKLTHTTHTTNEEKFQKTGEF